MPWSAGSVPGEGASAGREEGWCWQHPNETNLVCAKFNMHACPGQVPQGLEGNLCSSQLQRTAPDVLKLCPPEHAVLMCQPVRPNSGDWTWLAQAWSGRTACQRESMPWGQP